MKIIIDNKNNIICKTSLINNEDIKEEIKKQIEKMIFLDSIYSDNNYVIKSLKHELRELDLYNKFDIELYKYGNQDMIYIYGDNGLLELEIVEIENIIEL